MLKTQSVEKAISELTTAALTFNRNQGAGAYLELGERIDSIKKQLAISARKHPALVMQIVNMIMQEGTLDPYYRMLQRLETRIVVDEA